MTYTIDFSPTQEKQLADVASREGLEPNAYIKKIVAQHLPPSDPAVRVKALLAKWQTEDHTPALPAIPTQPGETETEALFRSWEEEDARMTEAERQAEDQLWEQIEAGLAQNKSLRLRQPRH